MDLCSPICSRRDKAWMIHSILLSIHMTENHDPTDLIVGMIIPITAEWVNGKGIASLCLHRLVRARR